AWTAWPIVVALCFVPGAAAQTEELPAPRADPNQGPPAWLPRYDIDMNVDVAGHVVRVHQRVTWTNTANRPAREIVFNAHSHYVVKDVGFSAKMLEILRMTPSEAIYTDQPSLDIERVACGDVACPFRYEGDTDTDLVVPLPEGVEVKQGQSIAIDLSFTFRLPQKQGRW